MCFSSSHIFSIFMRDDSLRAFWSSEISLFFLSHIIVSRIFNRFPIWLISISSEYIHRWTFLSVDGIDNIKTHVFWHTNSIRIISDSLTALHPPMNSLSCHTWPATCLTWALRTCIDLTEHKLSMLAKKILYRGEHDNYILYSMRTICQLRTFI